MTSDDPTDPALPIPATRPDGQDRVDGTDRRGGTDRPDGMDRRRFLLTSSAVVAGAAIGGFGPGDRPWAGLGPSADAAGAAGALGAAGVGVGAAAGGRVRRADYALARPGMAGLVDEAVYQQRIDAYLAHATASLNPRNPNSITAHLVRARRDPSFTWDVRAVSVASLADSFRKIDQWLDTRDFDLLYLLRMIELGEGDTPTTRLDPAVIEAVEARLVANRYRYDDPLPANRLDHLWFWSENHRIINLALEFLAGRRLAARPFAVTGLTGAQHAARARPEILDWLHERVELGFFEWHSHVYLPLNISPLSLLAELAEDPEVVAAAGIGLDLCLLDLAAHTHRGCYTAPRGRTYKKDKMSSLDEGTFNLAKFLFDDTTADYRSGVDSSTTFFCAARRYRPPQLLVEIATAPGTGIVRERHGVHFDELQPLTARPAAPHGKDFRKRENLPFWWSLGAVGMWPLAEVGVAAGNEFRLWDTEMFEQIALMAALNGFDPVRIRTWLHPRTKAINFGFLGEANTYAYRDDSVSLATVLDHRPGCQRDQAHAWQAAIDEHALVFTNHPITEPAQSTDWRDDGRPGYWTGEASMPRSAQHERTAVHLYLPGWDESTDPLVWSFLGYRPYTHAYVPQDHFEEVRQVGHWTVAAKGGAYIALWSWREPTWRVHDPAVVATRGMVKPFDLVAEGGPDNVWIVEVGTEADDGDLDTFLGRLTAHEPNVRRDADGFAVSWESPSSGLVELATTGPFRVAGREQPIGDFPRHESRWGRVEHLATSYRLGSDTATWAIDADGWTRIPAPPAMPDDPDSDPDPGDPPVDRARPADPVRTRPRYTG